MQRSPHNWRQGRCLRASDKTWIQAGGLSKESTAYFRGELKAGYRVAALTKGTKVDYQVQERGLFWMRATTSSWMGLTGGNGSEDIYIWVIFAWVRVKNLGSFSS